MAKPIRHPALAMEEGFLPPGIDGGRPGMPGNGPFDPAEMGMDQMQDEGWGAPGASPMKPDQEGAEEDYSEESTEEITPDMVAAGVKCLTENQGKMSPEDLVKDIYAAMEKAEGPENEEEGDPLAGEAGDGGQEGMDMEALAALLQD